MCKRKQKVETETSACQQTYCLLPFSNATIGLIKNEIGDQQRDHAGQSRAALTIQLSVEIKLMVAGDVRSLPLKIQYVKAVALCNTDAGFKNHALGFADDRRNHATAWSRARAPSTQFDHCPTWYLWRRSLCSSVEVRSFCGRSILAVCGWSAVFEMAGF